MTDSIMNLLTVFLVVSFIASLLLITQIILLDGTYLSHKTPKAPSHSKERSEDDSDSHATRANVTIATRRVISLQDSNYARQIPQNHRILFVSNFSGNGDHRTEPSTVVTRDRPPRGSPNQTSESVISKGIFNGQNNSDSTSDNDSEEALQKEGEELGGMKDLNIINATRDQRGSPTANLGVNSPFAPEHNLSLEVTNSSAPQLSQKSKVEAPSSVCDVTYRTHAVDFHNVLERECAAHDLRTGFAGRNCSGVNVPMCPCVPTTLKGPIPVSRVSVSMKTLHARFADVKAGGHWSPSDCVSHYRVAIVIPYRDREDFLKIFLNHLIPILQRQLISFAIYVVEQDNDSSFNRGMMFNIGFAEAQKDQQGFQCYVFSDVDLYPESDNIFFTCPAMPRHLSAAVSTFGYALPSLNLFGGTTALRTQHFLLINGYSNLYFGWGAEDDDLYARITAKGLTISRFPIEVARFYMAQHQKERSARDIKGKLRYAKYRFSTDGLNSLKYELRSKQKEKLFTLVRVKVNKMEMMEAFWQREVN